MPDALEIARPEQISPMSILQIAVTQGADIEKLTALMALQERWQANEARQAFNFAMAQFKKNPPRITKNKHVKFGQTEYDHATLDNVTNTITAALSAVGISHKWKVSQADQISVTCVLTHELGHSEETTLKAGADTSGSKNSIQAIGSAVTYLQRYTLLAAVGMATGGDDDGGDADTGNHLAEHLLVAALDDIEGCNTLPELQRVFARIWKMATEAGDKSAEMEFIRAKDARKAELRNG